MIIPHNHVSITSSQEISQICQPLAKFGITYFEYYRAWNDGSGAQLSNNSEQMKQLLISDCADPHEFGDKTKVNYLLWQTVPYLLPKIRSHLLLEKQRISREDLDVDNGIVIIKRFDGYIDFYNFASTKSNSGVVNFYLSNFDFLEQFIIFFREKAFYLIKSSIKNRIQFGRKGEDENTESKISMFEDNQKINIHKVFFDIKNPNHYATKTEYQCLEQISHGKSFKETARQLEISQRTVEHYLYNMKERFELNTTSELINMFWQSF